MKANFLPRIVIHKTLQSLPVCILLCAPVVHALEPFPLRETVTRVEATLATTRAEPTRLKKQDYLKTVAGIVEYFRHFQDGDGRIIDPFLHREFQYSTPCYAWAAAALVAGDSQTNLLPSASLALDSALDQLASGKVADNHSDFFTFPSMLAYEHLRDRVTPGQRKHWEELLRAIEPDRVYRDRVTSKRDTVHNWNIVALSGEFLRHQQGFTGMDYIEDNLALQMKHFTPDGLYQDVGWPMAYDHFPRHFLAVILERGYDGQYRAQLDELLDRAGWTSLLMQSPCGELPTGGRSSEHQWNEAMQCVTYEIWAARKQHVGDLVAARAFKRAARLALQSVQRWVRPSGELWIVKNRFDPAVRHGFMGYSSHSQYNLLAASMLSTAWLMADDSISEGTCPADVGGFVVQLPEFHKVFANAGGQYVELDTGADPAYNSTGLIRVQHAGLDTLPGPTDTPSIETEGLAVGVAWLERGRWQSLAGLGKNEIKEVKVTKLEEKLDHVRFAIRYQLGRPEIPSLTETYDLTPDGVRVTAEVEGKIKQLRVRFPAMAFDGERTMDIALKGAAATVSLPGESENFRIESPTGVELRRTGKWVSCRNGFLEEIYGEFKGRRVTYLLQPRKSGEGPTR